MASQAIGIIKVDETNESIVDLFVSVYMTTGDPADETQWERLGSTITGRDGRFAINFEMNDGSDRPRQAILVLEVMAGKPSQAQGGHRLVLEHRANPLNTEHFLIKVPEKALVDAGRAPRGSDAGLDIKINRRRRAVERQAQFYKARDRFLAEALGRRVEIDKQAEEPLNAMLRAFSNANTNMDNRLVAPDESVFQANLKSYQDGIQGTINASALTGSVSLEGAQLDKLRRPDGELPATIPANAISAFLRPKGTGEGQDLYFSPPLAALCLDEAELDPCLNLLEADKPVDDDTDDTNEEGDDQMPDENQTAQADKPLTETSLPLLMNRLLNSVSAPEAFSVFPFRGRAGTEDIQQGIDSFSLRSGPADVPSYHDFHHLSFAFDHVWTELMSNSLVAISKELVGKIVEMGLDPADLGMTDGSIKLRLPAMKGVVKVDAVDIPPIEIVEAFEITQKEWAEVERLGYDDELLNLAKLVIEGPKVVELTNTGLSLWDLLEEIKKYNKAVQAAKEEHRSAKKRGQSIIRYARLSAFARPRFQQFHQILEDLENELKSPYAFRIFGANARERSVNFGLLSTYRQKWEPVSYQVGELIRSVPLAPNEVRKYTRKTVVRKKRAQKEVENNLETRKTESSDIARTEIEIVEKAQQKTNFSMSAEGGLNFLVAKASMSNAFSRSAGTSSQDTKRQFREAVFKSAEEFRQERKLEVSVSSELDQSTEESGEISNPNDEITVTYLFYELQRRYRLSERLHRVRPVILVAQEVPNPSEIDDDWLIAHDWILRRVILDDSFLPALDYLSTKVAGDELALEELFQNVEQQRKITDALKEELVELKAHEDSRYAALQRTIKGRAEAVDEEAGSGLFEDIGDFFAGEDSPTPEKMQIMEDAARSAFDRSAKLRKEMQLRMEREVTSLNTITEQYTRQLSDHLNRRTQIARLRIHVKQNIIHYMQAIWAHEPPDQRLMRIKNVQVAKLTGSLSYTLSPAPEAVPIPPKWEKPMSLQADCKLNFPTEYEPLSKVADIDDLLGFKGNYMILPLKVPNLLTEYMMTPYLSAVDGLSDPDPLAGWTLQKFSKYLCCLHTELGEEDFAALRSGLIEAYKHLLTTPRSDNEEIVVPTDSLFIEALPGAHPILEDFKLHHRVIDVKRAQAEVRSAELENLRFAARLLAGERDDPDVEKRILVEGDNSPVIMDE